MRGPAEVFHELKKFFLYFYFSLVACAGFLLPVGFSLVVVLDFSFVLVSPVAKHRLRA